MAIDNPFARFGANLRPFYLMIATPVAEAEDPMDAHLGTATAARPGDGGPPPSDMAGDLAVWAQGRLPLRQRAALTYRHYRRHPGSARAARN